MPSAELQREHDIQDTIRLWCGQHGLLCFRCNVGKAKLSNGFWFDTGLPEGFSDLIIFANHTCYFCEVKTSKGRQREAQKRFQKVVEEHGYLYILARSVDDVADIICQIGGDTYGQ